MEFEINDSPELTMAEITKKLFNCKFLSDVQFHVDHKTIYGHSLELMKRSTVFRKQLGVTLGENKLIPITDVPYDSAYQFLRFIYTDECDVNNTNVIGILRLSKRYKVIKLENQLFQYIIGPDIWLSLYEYCLLENDQHHIRRTQETVNLNLKKHLSSNQLLKIHPIVMENILKFDCANASEVQLFDGLSRWITQHSQDNQIDIPQQKAYYDKYIRLIRFPVMTADEVIKCLAKHPQLFNVGDYSTIIRALAQKSGNERGLWHDQPRGSHSLLYTSKRYSNGEKFETKFRVSRGVTLNALRFGRHFCQSNIELRFAKRHFDRNSVKHLKLECNSLSWCSMVLNLGESIRLHPNIEYSIQFKYATKDPFEVYSRDDNTDAFINLPPDLIHFETVSKNMFEMHFTLVTN